MSLYAAWGSTLQSLVLVACICSAFLSVSPQSLCSLYIYNVAFWLTQIKLSFLSIYIISSFQMVNTLYRIHKALCGADVSNTDRTHRSEQQSRITVPLPQSIDSQVQVNWRWWSARRCKAEIGVYLESSKGQTDWEAEGNTMLWALHWWCNRPITLTEAMYVNTH